MILESSFSVRAAFWFCIGLQPATPCENFQASPRAKTAKDAKALNGLKRPSPEKIIVSLCVLRALCVRQNSHGLSRTQQRLEKLRRRASAEGHQPVRRKGRVR